MARRLLLVDDDDETRKLLADRLRDAGYEVDEACDGTDALVRLEAADPLPLAIITDLVMPRMSGHELIQLVKARARWEDIPIIAVSGTDRPPPGVMHLVKPVRTGVILSRLQHLAA